LTAHFVKIYCEKINKKLEGMNKDFGFLSTTTLLERKYPGVEKCYRKGGDPGRRAHSHD